MKTFTKQELAEVLELHSKWRFVEDGGCVADLRDANLCDADLRGADLRGANLHGANLRGANLHGADLRDANLHGANLHGANLRGTDLCDANLHGANLCDADLCDANLRDANLCDADLRGADLRDANLWNLTGNRLHVKTFAFEKYTVTYTAVYLQIGCERHTFEEWINFDDEKIRNMDHGALEWWAKWKDTIFKLIEMSPAVPTGAENKSDSTSAE